MDDELNIINKNEKHNHTNDELFINSDNVYLTYASVVKIKGNIYSVGGTDGSLKIEYDKLCKHIEFGDDVIINLNYKDYLIAGVIPKSLETKLQNAIYNEDYELAKIINDKIKNR